MANHFLNFAMFVPILGEPMHPQRPQCQRYMHLCLSTLGNSLLRCVDGVEAFQMHRMQLERWMPPLRFAWGPPELPLPQLQVFSRHAIWRRAIFDSFSRPGSATN